MATVAKFSNRVWAVRLERPARDSVGEVPGSRAWASVASTSRISERQLQPQLNAPRVGSCRADDTKIGRTELNIRVLKVCSIHNIEALRPKLQPEMLKEVKVPNQRGVHVYQAGSAHDGAGSIPKM